MAPAMKLCLLTLLVLAITSGAASAKPNVVFILADDLGIGDVHCYGGEHCLIDTPNLDALADEGLRFTDAHVNASVCGPTRVAIMTGRYPWRLKRKGESGSWGFVGPSYDRETFTLGDMFRQGGYSTGYVGKWHLGTVMTTVDGKTQGPKNVDYRKPLLVGPPQHGFDSSFILPGSLDMYPYAFARNNVWQGEVTAQKGWSAFNRVGPAERDFQDHEVLETFYREAESFIEGQSNEKPFFLYLALTAPHTPTSPGKNWQGKSRLGVYGDFVMEVDHAVARVRAALRRRGMSENTLILFSSDHGPASYAGNILKATPGQIQQLEKMGHHSNGPHRGYKFSVYEGGLRVPLLAHWPGTIAQGGTSDALVGLCDLMATLAEVIGVKLDPAAITDSISFANQFTLSNGESRKDKSPADSETAHRVASARTNLIMQSGNGCFAIRDGAWKLCLCPGSGTRGIYGNRPATEQAWRGAIEQLGHKPSDDELFSAPCVQLFDLAADTNEDHDLSASNPKRVANMIEMLKQQISSGRSTAGPRVGNQKNVLIHDRRVTNLIHSLR